MTIKKPVIAKPEGNTNRFAQAKKFAVKDNEATKGQTEGTADQNNEKAEPLKKARNDNPTVRENFDVEEPLRNEMRIFIANSRKFRNKRQFLTQCLKDGLEKYKGQ